jgi:hypothetical protein
MISEIFSDFLCGFDASLGAVSRKILLFVDDCAADSPDTSSLWNIKVVFYSPNCPMLYSLLI